MKSLRLCQQASFTISSVEQGHSQQAWAFKKSSLLGEETVVIRGYLGQLRPLFAAAPGQQQLAMLERMLARARRSCPSAISRKVLADQQANKPFEGVGNVYRHGRVILHGFPAKHKARCYAYHSNVVAEKQAKREELIQQLEDDVAKLKAGMLQGRRSDGDAGPNMFSNCRFTGAELEVIYDAMWGELATKTWTRRTLEHMRKNGLKMFLEADLAPLRPFAAFGGEEISSSKWKLTRALVDNRDDLKNCIVRWNVAPDDTVYATCTFQVVTPVIFHFMELEALPRGVYDCNGGLMDAAVCTVEELDCS